MAKMNNTEHEQKDWNSLWAQIGKGQFPHPFQKAPHDKLKLSLLDTFRRMGKLAGRILKPQNSSRANNWNLKHSLKTALKKQFKDPPSGFPDYNHSEEPENWAVLKMENKWKKWTGWPACLLC